MVRIEFPGTLIEVRARPLKAYVELLYLRDVGLDDWPVVVAKSAPAQIFANRQACLGSSAAYGCMLPRRQPDVKPRCFIRHRGPL